MRFYDGPATLLVSGRRFDLARLILDVQYGSGLKSWSGEFTAEEVAPELLDALGDQGRVFLPDGRWGDVYVSKIDESGAVELLGTGKGPLPPTG